MDELYFSSERGKCEQFSSPVLWNMHMELLHQNNTDNKRIKRVELILIFDQTSELLCMRYTTFQYFIANIGLIQLECFHIKVFKTAIC